MKRLILVFLVFVGLWACKDDNPPEVQVPELQNPTQILEFCGGNTSKLIRKTEISYVNQLKQRELITQQEDTLLVITYNYNSDKKLSQIKEVNDTFIKVYNYTYNNFNQVVSTQLSLYEIAEGDTLSTQHITLNNSFEGDKLTIEELEEGGYYKYGYNENKLFNKGKYNAEGEKEYTLFYTFANGLKIRERKEDPSGKTVYNRVYEYNADNLLSIVAEGEKVVESYQYDEDKLIEITITPVNVDAEDICGGNYLVQFVY